jgi:hypothetical protein
MTSSDIVIQLMDMSPLNITPLDIPKNDMSPLSIQICDMSNISDLEIPSPQSNQVVDCVYRRNINTNQSYQESIQEMEWIIMNELDDPNTSHLYFYYTIFGIVIVSAIFPALILIL